MNSIIPGGLDKGEGGIGSSLPSTALPARHGLGAERADPLSPLNHPSGQLSRTVLRIGKRANTFTAGDLLVDLRCSQRPFGDHQFTFRRLSSTFAATSWAAAHGSFFSILLSDNATEMSTC